MMPSGLTKEAFNDAARALQQSVAAPLPFALLVSAASYSATLFDALCHLGIGSSWGGVRSLAAYYP
jgi:hypothetical protein